MNHAKTMVNYAVLVTKKTGVEAQASSEYFEGEELGVTSGRSCKKCCSGQE